MSDISPPTGLQPKQTFLPALGEEVINVDAAIAMMMGANTPQAKALYRAFRRCLAVERDKRPELTPQKQRENALFASFKSVGIKTVDHGKVDGSFPA